MKKTIYKNFDYTQCNEFATFLSDMAAQGWHFKEWRLGLVFEKGEPMKEEYSVEIFIHGKEEDMKPDPQTEEFAEYCEAAGWEFVDAKRKFCIFKKIREDAMDIVTPEERIENIKDAEIGRRKGQASTIGVVLVPQLVNLFGTNFKTWIFDGLIQLVVLGLLVALIYLLVEILVIKRWANRQIERIRCEEQPVAYRLRKVKKILFGTLVLADIVLYFVLKREYAELLIIVGVVVCIVIFDMLIKKFRPSRDGYKMVGTIFFMSCFAAGMIAVVALFQSDSREPDYSTQTNQSIFGTYETGYYKFSETQMVRYTRYDCEHERILDRIWKDECEFMKETEQYVGTWDAKAVASLGEYRYMVRYDDCIGILSNVENLDAQQMKVIQEEVGIR